MHMKLQTKLFIALAAGLIIGAFSRLRFAIRLDTLLIQLEPIGDRLRVKRAPSVLPRARPREQGQDDRKRGRGGHATPVMRS